MTDPTARGCENCPSFLTADQAVSKFKKSIGSPMCGRYGHVLGKPGMAGKGQTKLWEYFAKNCPSFGEPLPPLPIETRMQVVMPDPDVRDLSKLDEGRKDMCASCASCKNFVREDVVADELGWTAGLCAAKGKLILSNRQVYEARECEFRQYGNIRPTTMGLHLLPEYEDAFQLNVDPIKAYFKNKKEGIVEPHDYPTDRDVTDEEREGGIRAWRKIVDPMGSGNEAFLPIYSVDHFSPEEQAKIPRTGDDEHPELYVDHFGGAYLAAVVWTELDETPALWGEAGTGKTELFRYLAWLMCLPFERISITQQTELDDLAGKMRFSQDRGTYFEYGRLPRAWSKPCVVVLDEPTTGPAEVWQFLRPLTDNSKQMVLDMNEGERIARHPDCFLGMANNPAWDAKNVGSLQIGDADANRLFHIWMDLPPESLEREIIRNRVLVDGWEITSDQLTMLMRIAGEIRAKSKDDILPISWGIRPQIKVARALRWFDPVTAYRRAVGDYLEPDAQEVLLDSVRAHLEGTH